MNGAGLKLKDTLSASGKWLGFYWRDGFVFTSPAGSFKPNAWGLYDTHGNVWEWCQDRYGEYPTGLAVDPTGPETGDRLDRVLRGGAWFYYPRHCRAAHRNRAAPSYRDGYFGFRLALDFE